MCLAQCMSPSTVLPVLVPTSLHVFELQDSIPAGP